MLWPLWLWSPGRARAQAVVTTLAPDHHGHPRVNLTTSNKLPSSANLEVGKEKDRKSIVETWRVIGRETVLRTKVRHSAALAVSQACLFPLSSSDISYCILERQDSCGFHVRADSLLSDVICTQSVFSQIPVAPVEISGWTLWRDPPRTYPVSCIALGLSNSTVRERPKSF